MGSSKIRRTKKVYLQQIHENLGLVFRLPNGHQPFNLLAVNLSLNARNDKVYEKFTLFFD